MIPHIPSLAGSLFRRRLAKWGLNSVYYILQKNQPADGTPVSFLNSRESIVNTDEKELEILENIYHSSSSIRQRDLAEVVGLSLGMTNAILKRLTNKGLLKIKKVNNRNIRYIVSPEGIEAISKKSYKFFRRTIKNVVYYKESIEKMILHSKEQGFEGIFLKGKSDLDFIIEHSCRKTGIDYILDPEISAKKIRILYGEKETPSTVVEEGALFLQDLFVKS